MPDFKRISHSDRLANEIGKVATILGLRVLQVLPYRTENEYFAHGGTYYKLFVLNHPKDVENIYIDEPLFYQWGLGYLVPTDRCCGPMYDWVDLSNEEEPYLMMTLIVDRYSEPKFTKWSPTPTAIQIKD